VPPSGVTRLSWTDRIAMLLATGAGIGYAPFASGTWGSLPGVAAAWLLWKLAGGWGVAAGAAGFAIAGIWAAGRASRVLGTKDPRQVVVDEIAGQLVTVAFLRPTAGVLIAGFFLFRLLDVWKPWPADRLEALPGGSGIMADDLMAGLYGNLVLHVIAAWHPGWLGLA
jgi:phosphatidylglycerophosphatase A